MREEPILDNMIKFGVPNPFQYANCSVCGARINIYDDDFRRVKDEIVCPYCKDEYIRNVDMAELMNYALEDMKDYRSYYYKEYHDLTNLELVKTILTTYEGIN